MKNLYAIFIFICVTNNIKSQEITTDRPDQTEASITVLNKSLQIESGVQLQFNNNSLGKYRTLVAPTTLFRYGIAPWIELRVVSQFESNTFNQIKSQGMSDLEVGTKIQLVKAEMDRTTDVAFLTHLVLPTGTESLTGKTYGSVNKLCISHGLTETTNIGYNIGYNYRGNNKGDLTYSLAYGISINNKVGVYIEPFGEITNLKIHEANFDAGFTYLIRENLQFDFSFGVGINHKMNYLSTGVSWLIFDKSLYQRHHPPR